MKKRKFLKTLTILGSALAAPALLTGCGAAENKTDPLNFRVQDGWLQFSQDGETWTNILETHEEYTNRQFTVSFDYGAASNLFAATPQTVEVEAAEWLMAALPEIKEEYKNVFLGWFIQGTEKQITSYDIVGGDVTLEARFDIQSEEAPSGLYQNGKYVKTWEDVKTEYPSAFKIDQTISCNTSEFTSYFTLLSGELVIDNSITSIGNYAFTDCKNLTSIEIPNTVTSIETSTFNGCESLTNIEIPNGVTVIGLYAFSGCKSLTNIEIPNSVTRIRSGAFSGCKSLTNITIPNSVISIEDYAFCASGLTSVEIPQNISCIGNFVFSECFELTSIEIPNTITTIGTRAFEYCTSLTSIEIPSSVTSIGKYAFNSCTSLTSIVVDEDNTVYDSRNNCNAIIETTTNKLLFGCKTTIIPSSVTSIGEAAFYGCESLTSIEIPSSVTSIGEAAFCGCESLTSIEIPSSVTSIEKNAFLRCDALTSITFEEKDGYKWQVYENDAWRDVEASELFNLAKACKKLQRVEE